MKKGVYEFDEDLMQILEEICEITDCESIEEAIIRSVITYNKEAKELAGTDDKLAIVTQKTKVKREIIIK